MRASSFIALLALSACTPDMSIVSLPADEADVPEQESPAQVVEDTETEDAPVDQPVDTEEPAAPTDTTVPCPTYMVRQSDGTVVEVSDELLIRGSSGPLRFQTGRDAPMQPGFTLSAHAPEGCGGLVVRGVSWTIQVMDTVDELEFWENLIVHPVDEFGQEYWRGTDLYELRPSPIGWDWLSTQSHGNYGVSIDNDTLTVNANFTASTDPYFEEIAFEGGADWRPFAMSIFLADRLPVGQMMSLSIGVSWEVDGIPMAPIWVAAPFYLDAP